MNELQKELLQAFKDNNAYDFIANNCYRIDKEDMKDIILELAWLIYKNNIDDSEIIENLKERWEY